jgi:predicted MFS family arabinose efflux permease
VLPTVTALVREIIEKKHLLIANTTIDMVYETGNVIGMAIAGFSVALLSNAGAIMLAGALFFISTAFAYGINTPYRSTIAKAVKVKEVFNDLIMGLNYIVKRTEIKVVYTLQLLSLVIYMVVPVLTAPFAHKYLHANVTQFGYLEALLSIGVVVGNILAAPMVNRLGLLTTMIIYNALLAICFTLFALNRDLTTAYVLHLFIGIGFAAWALIMTRAQEITDIDFQGRVSASFNSLSSVVMLIVYGIMYFEGKVISLSHLYYVEVLSAVISLALIIYYYRFFISAKQID